MARIFDEFVTILGDIKIFRWPLWVVYDPSSYRVRGAECRKILDMLEPGDILLRHYDGYLDNLFIPGVFSHGAIYLGEVTESDRASIPASGSATRSFETGPAMVAHSTAKGVHLEDVLTFLRCDDVAVVRLPDLLERIGKPLETIPAPLHPTEQALVDILASGGSVTRAQAVSVARQVALGRLGTAYDFAFDFQCGNRMSCTEFVKHCYRSVNAALNVTPRPQSLLWGLTNREIIEPDDFVREPMQLLHASEEANLKLRRARRLSL
ncbi:MAG: YiiX/YebB-like N1pC/P60 family cysteine hydrolase [Fibrobacterota bacterium]